MDTDESEQAKTIIQNSGNSLHYRIVDYLEKRGWKVMISPYYCDNQANKTKEVDIIAEKPFKLLIDGGGALNVRLFIECKYITDKNINVFWFDNKNEEQIINNIFRDLSLSRNQYDNYQERGDAIRRHHYMKSEKTAKLFSSRNEDRAPDKEIIYKGSQQTLNSLIFYRGQGQIFPSDTFSQRILKYANFPLIICQNFNHFFQTYRCENSPIKIDDNFQLEINYSYVDSTNPNKLGINKTEFFLIDIVNFEKIDDFMNELEETAKLIKKFIKHP